MTVIVPNRKQRPLPTQCVRLGNPPRKGVQQSRCRAKRLSKPSDVLMIDDEAHAVTTMDFQTLGLRIHECRLTVIRSAATRSTQTLASRQLKSPASDTEEQLCRVAHSAYRLMDPAQAERFTSTRLRRSHFANRLGWGRTNTLRRRRGIGGRSFRNTAISIGTDARNDSAGGTSDGC